MGSVIGPIKPLTQDYLREAMARVLNLKREGPMRLVKSTGLRQNIENTLEQSLAREDIRT